jgi:hypothetical protein
MIVQSVAQLNKGSIRRSRSTQRVKGDLGTERMTIVELHSTGLVTDSPFDSNPSATAFGLGKTLLIISKIDLVALILNRFARMWGV